MEKEMVGFLFFSSHRLLKIRKQRSGKVLFETVGTNHTMKFVTC